MTYYANTDQLLRHLTRLFERMRMEEPEATKAVSNSRLIIRLNLHAPQAVVLINGRYTPARVGYESGVLRPDLDISFSADTLHAILLKQISLKQALASGQMTVRGPIFKSFILEDIFRKGQALYPQVLHELSRDGSGPVGFG